MNHTAYNSSDWEVVHWNYNGRVFNSTAELAAAYNASTVDKLSYPKPASSDWAAKPVWSSLRRRGAQFAGEQRAVPVIANQQGARWGLQPLRSPVGIPSRHCPCCSSGTPEQPLACLKEGRGNGDLEQLTGTACRTHAWRRRQAAGLCAALQRRQAASGSRQLRPLAAPPDPSRCLAVPLRGAAATEPHTCARTHHHAHAHHAHPPPPPTATPPPTQVLCRGPPGGVDGLDLPHERLHQHRPLLQRHQVTPPQPLNDLRLARPPPAPTPQNQTSTHPAQLAAAPAQAGSAVAAFGSWPCRRAALKGSRARLSPGLTTSASSTSWRCTTPLPATPAWTPSRPPAR
jgi:hypothetical protein